MQFFEPTRNPSESPQDTVRNTMESWLLTRWRDNAEMVLHSIRNSLISGIAAEGFRAAQPTQREELTRLRDVIYPLASEGYQISDELRRCGKLPGLNEKERGSFVARVDAVCAALEPHVVALGEINAKIYQERQRKVRRLKERSP